MTIRNLIKKLKEDKSSNFDSFRVEGGMFFFNGDGYHLSIDGDENVEDGIYKMYDFVNFGHFVKNETIENYIIPDDNYDFNEFFQFSKEEVDFLGKNMKPMNTFLRKGRNFENEKTLSHIFIDEEHVRLISRICVLSIKKSMESVVGKRIPFSKENVMFLKEILNHKSKVYENEQAFIIDSEIKDLKINIVLYKRNDTQRFPNTERVINRSDDFSPHRINVKNINGDVIRYAKKERNGFVLLDDLANVNVFVAESLKRNKINEFKRYLRDTSEFNICEGFGENNVSMIFISKEFIG